MLSVQESIRPSVDLRNHYNEISKQCKENLGDRAIKYLF